MAALLLLSVLWPIGHRALAAGDPAGWQIVLTVVTPAYRLDDRGLHVAGYDTEDRPGAPALPVWTTVVELPAGSAWQLDYEAPRREWIPLEHPLPLVPPAPAPPADVVDAALPHGLGPLKQTMPAAANAGDALYPAEPVSAGPEQRQRDRRLLPLRVYPFQYDRASGRLLYFPEIRVTVRGQESASAAAAGPADRSASARRSEAGAAGALRIRTGQRGLHRLTYEDLAGAGLPLSTLDPASLAMSYLGEPIDIRVTGAGDGRFDPGDQVVFYAEPYQGRYMTHNVYWLAWGGEPGARMQERVVEPTGAEPAVEVITQTLHTEFDRVYYSTYALPRDADHFFDNPLYAKPATPVISTTYTLALDDAAKSGELLLRAAFHGGVDQPQDPDQSVAIRVNGRSAGVYRWNGSAPYIAEAVLPAAVLRDGAAEVALEAALDQLPGLESYWVSPDWVQVRYPALPRARLDRLYIEGFATTDRSARIDVTGFGSFAVQAYDVRRPAHPVVIKSVFVEYDGSSFTARLWDAWPAGDPEPSYALSTDAALLAPLAIEPDAPSNWRSAEHAYDYIAIVHRELWDAVQPLLDHRAAEGLRVAKVDVQDVYDEFGHGRVDPEAIRDFLSYAYHHWRSGGRPPRFVLLVGDGHYDFKGAQRPDLPNLIPPYLIDIDPWIGETAADNRYVSVDGPDDYLPDMHIGRIPAKSAGDVSAVVRKIIAYENSAEAGDWQRRVVFVADSNSDAAGNFHAFSDQVRLGEVPAGYVAPAIYYRMDAAHDTGPEMRAAIAAAFNQRALMLQWFGHASRQRWGSINMFDISDPARLAANTTWPFATAYTCWSGYFISVTGSAQYGNSELTLAEALLLAPDRGSVANLSPSGLHLGEALLSLNRGIVTAVLHDRITRVGEAVDAAKTYFFGHSSVWHDVIDTSILFGDPATKLRLPDIEYLPAVGAG